MSNHNGVCSRGQALFRGGVLVCALLMGLPVHAGQSAVTVSTANAWAAGLWQAKDASQAPVKKMKKKKTVRVAQAPERTPSGETVADRERRLTRECKGRPNAGACLGFAN